MRLASLHVGRTAICGKAALATLADVLWPRIIRIIPGLIDDWKISR
jgi:hypothetical protein